MDNQIVLDENCAIVQKVYLKVLEDAQNKEWNLSDEIEDDFQRAIGMMKTLLYHFDNKMAHSKSQLDNVKECIEFIKENDKAWHYKIEPNEYWERTYKK